MGRKQSQSVAGFGDAFAEPQARVVRREMAAALLGVSVATLHRMVRDGRVRPVRVLGRTRFRIDDLLALREPQ